MTSENDIYKSDAEIQWCPGCPNFGILKAFKSALDKLGRAPHEICLISGIGQAAKLPHYLRCNFFNGLHGRAIPVALGVHVANPELTTMVVTGDGDCYGEGGNHFLHALRRNPDITIVVHNNEIYALTKGQASPTTQAGEKRTLQVRGVDIAPLKALSIAIIHNCGFVGRGFAGNTEHLANLLVQAVEHRGLSLVDVIQPCITWGTHPVSWYKDRVYELGHDHDPTDKAQALSKAAEWGNKMPIGLLYKGASDQYVFADRFRKEVTDEPLAGLKPVSREEIDARLSQFRAEA
jgi:2-oxoglutarate ferredoxin oxidoreductase subunit beta